MVNYSENLEKSKRVELGKVGEMFFGELHEIREQLDRIEKKMDLIIEQGENNVEISDQFIDNEILQNMLGAQA